MAAQTFQRIPKLNIIETELPSISARATNVHDGATKIEKICSARAKDNVQELMQAFGEIEVWRTDQGEADLPSMQAGFKQFRDSLNVSEKGLDTFTNVFDTAVKDVTSSLDHTDPYSAAAFRTLQQHRFISADVPEENAFCGPVLDEGFERFKHQGLHLAQWSKTPDNDLATIRMLALIWFIRSNHERIHDEVLDGNLTAKTMAESQRHLSFYKTLHGDLAEFCEHARSREWAIVLMQRAGHT